MPFMATWDLKKRNIFNTMEFKIREIKQTNDDYMFSINNKNFTEQEFAGSFIPSFCITVNKYQGGEIDSHYDIYDINRMDKKTDVYSIKRNIQI